MQIVIDIPDEQIKMSLEESKSIHEDEGEKGFVNIMMLYTNGRLDFIDVSRKTDFYSCEYRILPKGHGRIADIDKVLEEMKATRTYDIPFALERVKPIIEADKESEVNNG